MQSTPDEQEIIVRGSEEHKEYLKYRHGSIKDKVNAIEAFLAVTGRLILVLYTVYVSVAAYLYNRLANPLPVWFVVLDIFMTALQVFGLEGSLAGLVHLRDDLVQRGKQAEANVIDGAVWSARLLLVASAIEIALELIGNLPGWNLSAALKFYTAALYVVRIFVISGYLIAMARLEHKGPRVISRHEAAKRVEEQEQKQIRIDNANIMAVFQKAIEDWSSRQPNLNASFSEAVNRLNETVSRKLESIESAQHDRIDALRRYVESAQIGSGTDSGTDSGTLDLKIESALSRSLADLSRTFEAKLGELSRQVNRVEAETTRQISTVLRAPQSSTTAPISNPAKEPEKAKARITNIAEAREEKQGSPSVDEVVAQIEADPSLLKLSGSQLAERLNTSKPTANRAKTKYIDSHPESAQDSDSETFGAANL